MAPSVSPDFSPSPPCGGEAAIPRRSSPRPLPGRNTPTASRTHTTGTFAFASLNAGHIGDLLEGVARFNWSFPSRAGLGLPVRTTTVEIVTASLGSNGVLLDGLTDRVDGLVVAAFGAGHVPESWCGRLVSLAREIPVVLASRTGAGSVLANTYDFPGSERYLLSRGLISAGRLDPPKARLLLYALLAAGIGPDDLAEDFNAHSS
ncbi:hypothetical protein ACIRQP_37660 [Streptomyces sp. NPDC102274]|uniref:hypothetical protein n=1 Tax=Streptomyces sp. NPDC102274 TaxID=3366151 RepID=UPI0037F3EA49